MNYRHVFHAGNFADVFKHLVLTILLENLTQKEKPFCYLETHAGPGIYDLSSHMALKSKEFTTGIGKILPLANENLPVEISDYLAIINRHNTENKIRFYPGSPLFAQFFLREHDRAVLAELHPEESVVLKNIFKADKRIAVHEVDGYQALKAFLPPKENRGLVLIDPPYEQNNEIERMLTALENALKHWRNGIYAIWYPIKDKKFVSELQKQSQNLSAPEILIAELSVHPDDAAFALNGSGMVIINPPYQTDLRLKGLLPWLWRILSVNQNGNFQVRWLKKV